MILVGRDITKDFGNGDTRIRVLDAVSLSLAPGETVALTGESGSGKSTLLHVLAGLEPADSGSVEVGGEALETLDEKARARIRRENLAIVFQQFNLIPSLSVMENLAFQARLAGRYDEGATRDLAAALGIADQLAKYPEDLSGGQQQRVAVGRALAAKPQLLLADEPTGNLDEDSAERVMTLMRDLARDAGAALLVATHSERLAATLDRRLHLSRGRLA